MFSWWPGVVRNVCGGGAAAERLGGGGGGRSLYGHKAVTSSVSSSAQGRYRIHFVSSIMDGHRKGAFRGLQGGVRGRGQTAIMWLHNNIYDCLDPLLFVPRSATSDHVTKSCQRRKTQTCGHFHRHIKWESHKKTCHSRKDNTHIWKAFSCLGRFPHYVLYDGSCDPPVSTSVQDNISYVFCTPEHVAKGVFFRTEHNVCQGGNDSFDSQCSTIHRCWLKTEFPVYLFS